LPCASFPYRTSQLTPRFPWGLVSLLHITRFRASRLVPS
jgi:hypothetical protein